MAEAGPWFETALDGNFGRKCSREPKYEQDDTCREAKQNYPPANPSHQLRHDVTNVCHRLPPLSLPLLIVRFGLSVKRLNSSRDSCHS